MVECVDFYEDIFFPAHQAAMKNIFFYITTQYLIKSSVPSNTLWVVVSLIKVSFCNITISYDEIKCSSNQTLTPTQCSY